MLEETEKDGVQEKGNKPQQGKGKEVRVEKDTDEFYVGHLRRKMADTLMYSII